MIERIRNSIIRRKRITGRSGTARTTIFIRTSDELGHDKAGNAVVLGRQPFTRQGLDVDGCFIRDGCDNACRGGRGRAHIERSADAMLIGIDGCLDGIDIIASRSTVCCKIVRRTPASARGTADTEPTCDAESVEQRQRSGLGTAQVKVQSLQKSYLEFVFVR